MEYSGKGYIRIKASIASSAIPIEGAVVRVFGVEEENYGIEYASITDIDGLSAVFALPAPPRDYSLSPNPAEAPYAQYRIEVEKHGYKKIDISEIQIFDGIAGVLPINMISNEYAP